MSCSPESTHSHPTVLTQALRHTHKLDPMMDTCNPSNGEADTLEDHTRQISGAQLLAALPSRQAPSYCDITAPKLDGQGAGGTDNSVVKSICCSCREPGLSSKYPDKPTIYNSSSYRIQTLFWPPQAPGIYMVHIYMQAHAHINRIKINKPEKQINTKMTAP